MHLPPAKLHLVERDRPPRMDRRADMKRTAERAWGNFCSRGNRHFLLFSRRSPAVRPRPALSKTRTRRIGRSTYSRVREECRERMEIEEEGEGRCSERILRVQERWSSRYPWTSGKWARLTMGFRGECEVWRRLSRYQSWLWIIVLRATLDFFFFK